MYFLHLMLAQGTGKCPWGFLAFGLKGSSDRWSLGHMYISSQGSSLKTQMIQMSMLFSIRGPGKGTYFNLTDRGSLTCCCTGLFPLCLHSAKIKYSLNNR